MKQIKFITAICLCIFLMASIDNQAEASKSSPSFEESIGPRILKSRECTLADGRKGRIPDCFIASTGNCSLPNLRRCNAR